MTSDSGQKKNKAKRSRTVALATVSGRAWTEVINGVIDCAAKYGWSLLTLRNWLMRPPPSIEIDGLILGLPDSERHAASRLCATYPLSVNVGTAHLPARVPKIGRDDLAVGVRAAEYFINRGFTNLVFAGFSDQPIRPDRQNGFRQYVLKAGKRYSEILSLEAREEDVDFEIQRGLITSKLRDLDLPVAIFCTNDRLAARVCYWCFDQGFAVPEQVAVLGAGNDVPSCESNPIPISSIDYGDHHRGVEAARLLQGMMDGDASPAESVLVPPGEVVTRRSTDIIAITDLPTALALRYIWDNYRNNISVEDIADAIDISQRTLVRHFCKALGHGINKEISVTRLKKACELLAKTEIPAEDIAALTGFRSSQYFSRRFKRQYGVSPKIYRKQKRHSLQEARTTGSSSGDASFFE